MIVSAKLDMAFIVQLRPMFIHLGTDRGSTAQASLPIWRLSARKANSARALSCKRRSGKNNSQSIRIRLARVHIPEMKQLTCKCGAIYEVTENEVPFKGPYSSRKCVLCESELGYTP